VPLRSIRFVPVVGFFVLLAVLLAEDPKKSGLSRRADQGDLAVAFMVTMGALLAIILVGLLAAALNLRVGVVPR
jgi:hypothetical protein